MRFELQKTQLFRYFTWTNILSVVPMMVIFLGLITLIMFEEGAYSRTIIIVCASTVLLATALLAFLIWLSRQMVDALEYEVEDHILYVSEGVFVYSRKAIPLDRVTDIQLVQGLLMRQFNIWKVQVQTASHGSLGAEGVLWGIGAPKQVRSQLIEARKAAVLSQRIDAAA